MSQTPDGDKRAPAEVAGCEKANGTSTPEAATEQVQFRAFGGSKVADSWNLLISRALMCALPFRGVDEKEADKRVNAAVLGLAGIAPKDELEAMIATQMMGMHFAAMDCLRDAALAMHLQCRTESLNQAAKLSRTFAGLLEGLNRHRGKGQQKVVVEHVHVHAGGQAVVGTVEAPGTRGFDEKNRNDPMQSNLPMHQSRRCQARTRAGTPCQSPALKGASKMSNARRHLDGRPAGQPTRAQNRSTHEGGHQAAPRVRSDGRRS